MKKTTKSLLTYAAVAGGALWTWAMFSKAKKGGDTAEHSGVVTAGQTYKATPGEMFIIRMDGPGWAVVATEIPAEFPGLELTAGNETDEATEFVVLVRDDFAAPVRLDFMRDALPVGGGMLTSEGMAAVEIVP